MISMDEKNRKKLLDGICPFCGEKIRFITMEERGGSVFYSLYMHENKELKRIREDTLDEYDTYYFCYYCGSEYGSLTEEEIKMILRNGSRR
ncbi:MAG: hypothetical protein NC918_08295 [Candidatus Omnitrophica bacterium]|nr:hypothetical protein [Candidatus Omnitrophota bacterium]